MGRDHDRSIAGDDAARFLGALLNIQGAEPTQVNIFALAHGVLHNAHESLYNGHGLLFLYSGLFGDLGDYICFGHGDVFFVSTNIRIIL